MNSDNYKLTIYKCFKNHDIRSNVIKFVIKTLDKIAYPTLTGETLNMNLFKIC